MKEKSRRVINIGKKKKLGIGIVTCLCLCESWFSSGRIILSDSWLVSMKLAENLRNYRLYFICTHS